jgi:hypothetical protein
LPSTVTDAAIYRFDGQGADSGGDTNSDIRGAGHAIAQRAAGRRFATGPAAGSAR